MSSSLSGSGGLPGGPADRGARALHELVDVAHERLDVERPRHMARLDAADRRSSPLSLASAEPCARIKPERAQRAALARVLRDGAVGSADLGGGLLVVDVLELDEGPVAGGEEARLDRLARAVGADAAGRCRPKGACPCWCETDRPPRCAPAVPRGSALQLELSLDLEVGAADLVLESLVEQVLDALLVVAAPAGDERQRGKQQQGGEATHAAQDSGRTRAAWRSTATLAGPPVIERMRRSSGQSWSLRRPSSSRRRPAQAGEVILVDR